uniref:Nudix hydrolase domain-containing protein n=1 Tax=Rhabditophanes sp. KR3021 TaxID=114890 RepID=A0AC35UFJ8_9BILA
MESSISVILNGGMADHKEQITETGVETVSEGILCFRHSHRTPYPQCSDIYFLVVLKPKDENNITPTPCPSEAAAADWLTIKQIQNLSTKEKHPFIDNMIVQYQKWKKRKG